MRFKFILVLVLFFFLFAGLVYQQLSMPRHGFVYTTIVFDKFEGTAYLQDKLTKEKKVQTAYLDSLAILIGGGRKELNTLYEKQKQYFESEFRESKDKYTQELWRHINESIKLYGDENGFDFIYGASGDGALMYANQSFDMTDEIVAYINKKYQAGASNSKPN